MPCVCLLGISTIAGDGALRGKTELNGGGRSPGGRMEDRALWGRTEPSGGRRSCATAERAVQETKDLMGLGWRRVVVGRESV